MRVYGKGTKLPFEELKAGRAKCFFKHEPAHSQCLGVGPALPYGEIRYSEEARNRAGTLDALRACKCLHDLM